MLHADEGIYEIPILFKNATCLKRNFNFNIKKNCYNEYQKKLFIFYIIIKENSCQN